MKTGGTLNFLKRAGAILMLVAVFASSCNKYADDFKQLNTKLDGLASSIGGMSTLTADLASVKASIASALTAIAALPNAATHTAMQTSLTALATSVATIQTNLAALTTTVNGLPKLADVNAIATKVAADLTVQLAATNKAIQDAMKTNNTTLTSSFTAAIAANNAILDALVKADLVANNAKIADAIAANNAAISKAIADNNAAISAAIVANNPAITAAEAAAMVANNSAIAAEIVKNNPAIAALIAANNAAISAAVIGNNTAMATMIQDMITALKAEIKEGTTDSVASVTVKGLQLLLNAQAATLATILANTIKSVGVATITSAVAGVTINGVLLTASATDLASGVTIPATSLTYQWKSASTSTGTYSDISGATTSTYTPVLADVFRYIKVSVVGTGSWAGSSTPVLSASVLIGAQIPVTAIGATTGAGGLFKVGVKLTAGDLTPLATTGTTVSYQWTSSATQFGVYTAIAGATNSTYTPVSADATTYISVVATGTGGWYNAVTANPVGPITYVDVKSNAFTCVPANNTITITLTGGTFNSSTVAPTLVKSQFVFLGEDATALYAGTFTRVSSTVVTFTTTTNFNASSTNTVTVLPAAMATQATSVTATSTTEVMLTPVGLAISGLTAPVYTVPGTAPVTTVTGTGFTGTVVWSGSPATFANGTTYTATVSLTANSNYTFAYVAKDTYTVVGATSVKNNAGSGTVTVVFPATAIATLLAADGELKLKVPQPVTGAVGVTAISGANFTAAVTWSPALVNGLFQSGTAYTATVAVVPNVGWTTNGCAVGFWTTTVPSAVVSYVANATNVSVAYVPTL